MEELRIACFVMGCMIALFTRIKTPDRLSAGDVVIALGFFVLVGTLLILPWIIK